ncbi:MAG: hypothetical protein K2N94_00385, partial [Lachnospiraceae bacterium]|nr:hypothetical protein [Lachnospiraceae bacterium]
GGAIGAKSIDLIAEIGSEAGDRKGKLAKSPVNLGNIPLLMNQKEFELKLNTYENEFSVKYIASLPFITDDAAFGLKLGWKWGDKSDPGFHVDEVMLYADFDVPMKAGPVDLMFSDFKFGLKGMTDSNPTLTGGFNASAWKLESVLPGISKYLGDMADVSVLSAEDAEISLRLQDFYIGASTTIKLLKYIELGGVKLELGKFEYTNKLLGLDSETVTGFAAKVNAGPAIHTTNCDISMQGAVEVAATNRALVIPGVEGNIDIAVKWWVFTKDFHAHGKALLGVQFTHDGDTIFCAKASGGTNVFYIQWSKRRGADVGSKKL